VGLPTISSTQRCPLVPWLCGATPWLSSSSNNSSIGHPGLRPARQLWWALARQLLAGGLLVASMVCRQQVWQQLGSRHLHLASAQHQQQLLHSLSLSLSQLLLLLLHKQAMMQQAAAHQQQAPPGPQQAHSPA